MEWERKTDKTLLFMHPVDTQSSDQEMKAITPAFSRHNMSGNTPVSNSKLLFCKRTYFHSPQLNKECLFQAVHSPRLLLPLHSSGKLSEAGKNFLSGKQFFKSIPVFWRPLKAWCIAFFEENFKTNVFEKENLKYSKIFNFQFKKKKRGQSFFHPLGIISS